MIRRIRKSVLLLAFLLILPTIVFAGKGTSMPAPPAGKAQIVFMRPAFFGFAIKSSVFDVTSGESKVIGVIKGKKKFVHTVDPGKHTFMVIGENADFIKANLEAGKTYYVLIQTRMGGFKARFTLVPIHKEKLGSKEFAKWNKKSRLLEMDMAKWNKWAEKHMDSINAKRGKYIISWDKKPDEEKARYTLNSDDGIMAGAAGSN